MSEAHDECGIAAIYHLPGKGVSPLCVEPGAEGVSRLNVLGSMLGLPSRTVAEVTEPFLIRSGLVIKDDQGRRQLTGRGREHLAACCQNPV